LPNGMLLTLYKPNFQVKTDKYLKLKFGKNERDFPIKLVSDAKIVQDDVNQFVTSMKAVREPTLTKREANKKRKSQDDLVNNYVYTVEDIESNMKDRKKKGMPVANMGSEQTKAAIAVQGARASLQEAKIQYALAQKRSDDAKIADAALAVQKAEQRLKERIDVEQKLLEFVTNHKQRLTSRSKDQKWAKVNQRAKKANHKADLEVAKEKEDTGNANAFNPYARRKVKPIILWEVGQQDEKKSDENAADVKKDALSSAANRESTGAEDATTPSLIQEQQEKAAALSHSHQFAIDEEVLALSSYTKGISGLGSNKRVRKRVRKGLSLSEYQERKAAGTL
jgi:RNA polymerase-associated protein RTF1